MFVFWASINIFVLRYLWMLPAYTNNEINSGKNHETYTCFSAVVGGQHIVKLTTSPFAPPNIILKFPRLLVIPIPGMLPFLLNY